MFQIRGHWRTKFQIDLGLGLLRKPKAERWHRFMLLHESNAHHQYFTDDRCLGRLANLLWNTPPFRNPYHNFRGIHDLTYLPVKAQDSLAWYMSGQEPQLLSLCFYDKCDSVSNSAFQPDSSAVQTCFIKLAYTICSIESICHSEVYSRRIPTIS